MEGLTRLQASRRGYRAHITKTFGRITEITDSAEPTTPTQLISLRTALEQLQQKKVKLEEVDTRIADSIQDATALEEEICEVEDYRTVLMEKIAFLQDFISSPRIPSPTNTETSRTETIVSENIGSDEDTNPDGTVTSPQPPKSETEDVTHTRAQHTGRAVSESMHHSQDSSHHNMSRLPKLSLPYFSGDPLMWQTFWDSFIAAVHTNPNLTGVQKFNYLKAQLKGDAIRVVSGFPLTDVNYQHSITLLRERFGQPYKVINAHMQALLNLCDVTNSLSSLQSFYDTVENHIRGLSSLGKFPESYGDLLTPIIFRKLPKEIQRNLARDHSNAEWTLDDLRSSIMKEIRILETEIHTSRNLDQLFNPSTPLMTTASFYTNTRQYSPQSSSKRPANCIYCKKQHSPNSCDVVTNTQDRLAIIKRNNLCFNCLAHHKVSQCNSKFRCRHCKRKHHTSICTDSTQSSVQEKTESPKADASDPKKTTIALTPATQKSNAMQSTVPVSSCLLKTAIAMIGSSAGISLEGNILFDEGAQRSFISQDMAIKLNLQPCNKESISLASFGATSATHTNLPTGIIQIQTVTGERIPISVLIAPKIAPPLQNMLRTSLQQIPHLKGLHLAHPITENENFEISILIGADYYWSFVQDHVIRGDWPTAVQSKLGYLLSGPLPTLPQGLTLHSFHVSQLSIMEVPNIEQFWNVEAAGTTPSKEEDPGKQFLRSYIQSSITCQPDGSYSLRFPWKQDHPPLPSNYNVCERRTRSLAKRLANTPDILQTYSDIISEQESRGFIEQVETTSSTSAHYIPHHPVKKESSTTPIRIVYDCSCRQSVNQPSLNDCLMVGPTFLNDMCSILLRFRTHKYGLSTDIEKAFLHVTLHEADRDFTCFLWLSDPTDPESNLIVYRFRVVLFGSVSSPFMLNAALHCHLQKYPSPVATDIERNLYVDNIISGCNTEQDTVDFYYKSRSTLSQAKFNLRSWASNSKQVQMLAKKHNVADNNDTTKVLGLVWHIPSDTLSLTSKIITGNYPITKREILQSSSSIFDPLGFITSVTIQTKILLQELWKMKVDWDEPLEESLQQRWNKMIQEVKEAAGHVMPRRYFTSMHFSPQELHIFADASMKAYGAVAYFKQDQQTSLVMSKTKVTPLKTISLPRLELMAAVLASRLCKFIISSIKYKCTVHLWSDSQIVLHWLNSSKQLKPFISTRVGEIVSTFPTSCWQYCPTADNPADLLTRGINSQQLILSTTWRYGPTWLTSRNQWPTWNPSEVTHSQHPEVIATLAVE